MKQIEVVAAVIHRKDEYLAVERGYGEFQGKWEFPGGKIEAGEHREEALIREIKEELEADIEIEKVLCTVEYTYETFHLIMHCYLCSVEEDALVYHEHSAHRWVRKDQFDSVDWLPADIEVLSYL